MDEFLICVDGGMLSFDSKRDVSTISSTLYKLEIITVELHSVYGDQASTLSNDILLIYAPKLLHMNLCFYFVYQKNNLNTYISSITLFEIFWLNF